MDLQHEFERYLRYELPIKLNLSPSKQMACEKIFYQFSDSVKNLAVKSRREFLFFFDSLKEHIDRVARWRCPKGHTIHRKIIKDEKGLPTLSKRYAVSPLKGKL
jgi:hypothetical protein